MFNFTCDGNHFPELDEYIRKNKISDIVEFLNKQKVNKVCYYEGAGLERDYNHTNTILEALKFAPTVFSVELKHFKWEKESTVSQFYKMLYSKNNNITELILNVDGLFLKNMENAIFFVNIILDQKKLSKLSLKEVLVSYIHQASITFDERLLMLGNIIARAKYLKYLYLSDNHMPYNYLEILGKYIELNKSLLDINFSNFAVSYRVLNVNSVSYGYCYGSEFMEMTALEKYKYDALQKSNEKCFELLEKFKSVVSLTLASNKKESDLIKKQQEKKEREKYLGYVVKRPEITMVYKKTSIKLKDKKKKKKQKVGFYTVYK